MIFTLLKFPFYFVIFYAIFSIPIQRKSLFYHVSGTLNPITSKVTKVAGQYLSTGQQLVKDMAKKLFQVNIPESIDAINQSFSGTDKLPKKRPSKKMTEYYSDEDKSKLDDLIQKSSK